MNWKAVLRRSFSRRAAAALVLSLAVGFAAPGHAAEPDEIAAGPKVGAKIPHDLSTLDSDGQHRNFKALAHERGLVILFNRSVDW